MPDKTDHPDVYVASQSGSCELDGETYVFVRGVTRIRAGHALLKAVPDYFRPAEDTLHYDIEQATAAPGERRGQHSRRQAKREDG